MISRNSCQLECFPSENALLSEELIFVVWIAVVILRVFQAVPGFWQPSLQTRDISFPGENSSFKGSSL